MKRIFLIQWIASAILLFSSITGYAQKSIPDDGITSEIHKQNIGKIVFSKNQIEFKKENANALTSNFNWGETIYGRFYWDQGMNNYYKNNNWKLLPAYFVWVEILLNDELISSYYERIDPVNTTKPFCLWAAESDSYKWKDLGLLMRYLQEMKPGKNVITLKLYPYHTANELKGSLISSGSMNILVPEKAIQEAKECKFSSAIVKNAEDEYSWSHYFLGVYDKKSEIYTTQIGNANEWYYYFGINDGKIFSNTSGNFSQFTLQSGSYKVSMNMTNKHGWQEWIVDDASTQLTVSTTKHDFSNNYQSGTWNHWIISGNNGKILLNIKWNDQTNGWKEWMITDDMTGVNGHLKMAAIFICLFNSIP